RGTPRHAMWLGLIVTIAHTLGVFALGFVTLFASAYVVPERLYPWLGACSGLAITAVGLALLGRHARHTLTHALHRPHEHGHEHGHSHGHHHHDGYGHHHHGHSHAGHDHAHEHGVHSHGHGSGHDPHTHAFASSPLHPFTPSPRHSHGHHHHD